MSLVGLQRYKEQLNDSHLTANYYFSSSVVDTSPIRLTVSIPPDTLPNIEWLSTVKMVRKEVTE